MGGAKRGAKTYKIKTIGDLLMVPEDRLDACLAELAPHIRAMKRNGMRPKMLGPVTWIDDGEANVSARWTSPLLARLTGMGDPARFVADDVDDGGAAS